MDSIRWEDLMAQGKIGLLPLYIKLYDDVHQESRPMMDAFYDTIASAFTKRGIQVVIAPVCRVSEEFASAVKSFEESDVDAIVTLHLAYSPSLESARILATTKLPILVLDTTPSWSYGPTQDPEALMYNHGIHGVQDMCSLLVRNSKPFLIEAGHWERSNVLDRIIGHLPAARAALMMKQGRVGLLGNPFPGMGDFYVSAERLESTIGACVTPLTQNVLEENLSAITPEDIEKEIAHDLQLFKQIDLDQSAHRRSVWLGLALRRWMKNEDLSAFTFNFQDMEKRLGYPTVPFLEASKAMARGVGYAGEGDVLTAMLVAAMACMHPDVSFTEMFCPDWENNSIFLSHMGELNWALSDVKASIRTMADYTYSATDVPAFLTGRFKPGNIALINLTPAGESGYRMIIIPASMLPIDGEDRMEASIHGWFKPSLPIADFLTSYSNYGGTHHLALVYDPSLGTLKNFATLMGWETIVIE
ncbi:MAG: hypothetical protein AB7T74_04270 [Clostridia bacterium]